MILCLLWGIWVRLCWGRNFQSFHSGKHELHIAWCSAFMQFHQNVHSQETALCLFFLDLRSTRKCSTFRCRVDQSGVGWGVALVWGDGTNWNLLKEELWKSPFAKSYPGGLSHGLWPEARPFFTSLYSVFNQLLFAKVEALLSNTSFLRNFLIKPSPLFCLFVKCKKHTSFTFGIF